MRVFAFRQGQLALRLAGHPAVTSPPHVLILPSPPRVDQRHPKARFSPISHLHLHGRRPCPHPSPSPVLHVYNTNEDCDVRQGGMWFSDISMAPFLFSFHFYGRFLWAVYQAPREVWTGHIRAGLPSAGAEFMVEPAWFCSPFMYLKFGFLGDRLY